MTASKSIFENPAYYKVEKHLCFPFIQYVH